MIAFVEVHTMPVVSNARDKNFVQMKQGRQQNWDDQVEERNSRKDMEHVTVQERNRIIPFACQCYTTHGSGTRDVDNPQSHRSHRTDVYLS